MGKKPLKWKSPTDHITPQIWAAAIAEASKRGANTMQIAARYRINRTTLINRVKTQNSAAFKSGPAPVLGVENERLIHDHLIWMADAGFGLNVKRLQLFARSCARRAGIPESEFNASFDWVTSFFKRHPDVASRKSKKVNGVRVAKFNRIIVQKWFLVWEEVSKQYTAEEIVNCDDKHLNSEELLDKKVRAISS